MKKYLREHPEGVTIWCQSIPHAVFVTGYSGSKFYCADTVRGYSGKRRTLASSYLGSVYGSQSSVLKHVTIVGYVAPEEEEQWSWY